MTDPMREALEACRIIDAAVKKGHDNVSDLLTHLLEAAVPARAALAAAPQPVPETMAWAVGGSDGALVLEMTSANKVPPARLHEGERVVRVAIRVVEEGDDAKS